MPTIWFIIATALFLYPVSTLFALDSALARTTLKGLQGVFVIIESLDPEVEKAGLTSAELRTDVELSLRLAGIRVLSEGQGRRIPGAPYLYVRVNVVTSTPSIWPYSIDVELNQYVTLDRDRNIRTTGATWSVGSIGTVTLSNIRTAKDRVNDKVDEFINAYLAVNPKR